MMEPMLFPEHIPIASPTVHHQITSSSQKVINFFFLEKAAKGLVGQRRNLEDADGTAVWGHHTDNFIRIWAGIIKRSGFGISRDQQHILRKNLFGECLSCISNLNIGNKTSLLVDGLVQRG